MYKVIEFEDNALGIVRNTWLTPRKKECLWPPYKLASKFNKCLLLQELPDENWPLYAIKRVMYETDELQLAREKCKKAESESDLVSDSEQSKKKRKRKPNIFSSDTEDEEDENYIPFKYPDPPKLGLSICKSSRKEAKKTLTTESIAAYIAGIQSDIQELKTTQNDILSRLTSSSSAALIALPDEIALPLKSLENLDNIETWLENDENKENLVNNLSFIGGNNIATITRRILQRVFCSLLAVQCNWTGKNNKTSLKKLQLIQVIITLICVIEASHQIKAACKKLKCPAISDPICVRMKYISPTFTSKAIYMVLLNNCEMKYLTCHEGVIAKKLPMKFCDHGINVTANPSLPEKWRKNAKGIHKNSSAKKLFKRSVEDDDARRQILKNSPSSPPKGLRTAIPKVVRERVKRELPNSYEPTRTIRQQAEWANEAAKNELFNKTAKPLKKYKVGSSATLQSPGNKVRKLKTYPRTKKVKQTVKRLTHKETSKLLLRNYDSKRDEKKRLLRENGVITRVGEGIYVPPSNSKPGRNGALSEADEGIHVPPSNSKPGGNGALSEADEGIHVPPPNSKPEGNGALSEADEGIHVPPSNIKPGGNGALSEADEGIHVPPLNSKPGGNGALSEADEGIHVPPPNSKPGGNGALSEADEGIHVPPPNSKPGGNGALSEADEGIHVPPSNSKPGGNGVLSEADEGIHVPPLNSKPGGNGALSEADEGIHVPPPNSKPGGNGALSEADEGIHVPPPNSKPGGNGALSEADEGIHVPPSNSKPGGNGALSEADEGIYAPPSNSKPGGNGALSEADEGIHVPPSNSKPGGNGALSEADEGIYAPPSNSKPGGNGALSEADEGIHVPPSNSKPGGNGALSEADEGIYAPPSNSKPGGNGASSDADEGLFIALTQKHERYSNAHSKESKEYVDKRSEEIDKTKTINTEENKECPKSCPLRGVMTCGLCRHNIYRTFLSKCHMRMFECRNKAAGVNERLILVANRPCSMSLPYFNDMIKPSDGIKDEPEDTDAVLNYLKCQHYGFQKIRPWANLNCTNYNTNENKNVTI